MTTREALNQVLEDLPDSRLAEVLDFAAFLRWRDEDQDWRRFGLSQFARAYGENEPGYSLDDVQPESSE
jgi:hypothetical protein